MSRPLSGGFSWIRLALALSGIVVPIRVRAAWRLEWERELEAAIVEGMPSGPISLFRGMITDAWVVRRLERRPFSDMDEEGMMRRVWTMFRQALKGLTRSPGFAALSVMTLAIGLGAAAAVFSVVDHVLLRPLPYPDANELVLLQHPVPGFDAQGRWPMSVAGYFETARRTQSLQAVGNYNSMEATLSFEGRIDRVQAAQTSTSFFDVIRATPALGRLFNEDEDEPGAPLVAVLGHGFWQAATARDPNVIGSVIELNGASFQVVGVMDEGVHLPDAQVDIWVPRQLDPAARPVNSHYIPVMGRLAEGQAVESANAEFHDIVRSDFTETFPNVYGAGFMTQAGFSGEVVTLRSQVLGSAERPLWAVFGAVGIVLLLAAANVANLFLVRAESRRRETAVRRALGASRGRLLEQAMGEGLAISLVSITLGLMIAAVLLPALKALAPDGFPRIELIELDLRTVGMLILCGLIIGAVVGMIPSLASGSLDGIDLTNGDRSGGKSGGTRTRKALVALQMALAVVLLTSAGLMLRTASALSRVEPGFNPENAVVMEYSIPWWEFSGIVPVTQYLTASLDRIRDIPGVTAAGIINQPPMSGPAGCWTLSREETPAETAPCPVTRFVSDGYFEAMGIPVVQGRSISRSTLLAAGDEVVVSQGIADLYLEGDAMGKGVITARSEGPFHHVSGVTGPVHDQGVDQPATPMIYFPLRPVDDSSPSWSAVLSGSVVVRTDGRDVMAIVPLISTAMAAANPLVSTANPRTLEQMVRQSRLRQTFTMTLLMVAALIALVLGAIGLYGVVAYAVSQRRGEIGVRMALGAAAQGVGLMVLRESLSLVAIGALLGVAASLFTSRLLQGLLFGVEGLDAITMGSVLLVLILSGALAAWLPARRAASVDPATCLRSS